MSEDRKVWAVGYNGGWEEDSVLAVFTSEAKANAWLSEHARVKCHRCRGRGRTLKEVVRDIGGGTIMRTNKWMPCETCNGTGHVFDQEILHELPLDPEDRVEGMLDCDRLGRPK